MYLSEKQHPIDFGDREMMIEVVENGGLQPQQLPQQQQQQQQQQPQQMMFGESSGEEHEVKAPKKRAETWAQEEIRSLINLRREIDYLFNTTKSNRHLWEQISSKMREKGFDRSPTMCTDKWRNLLKEFKKAKHHARGSGSAKMSYYKEIAEILRERNKNAAYKSPPPSKVDPYIRFSSDKDYFEDADINSGSCLTRESFYLGLDDTSISFGHMEASGRSTLNLERRLDHDGHPLAITEADAVGTNGVNPWNWREASGNGGDSTSYDGRVITVKWGEFTRRIGIDGPADAIKEAIKSGFGLRTRRAFWLEDENEVIRSLDREMPLGTYTLHLDDGITIKVCSYDESDRLPVPTDEKTFYTEEELHEFLNRRGWACLRELSGFRSVDTMEELRPGEMYQGVVRMLAE